MLSVGKSGFFEPSTNPIGAAASTSEPTPATAAAANAAAAVGQADDSDSDNSQDARAAKKQAKVDARRVRVHLLLGLLVFTTANVYILYV